MNDRNLRLLTMTTAGLVGLIALLSFVLSYASLQEVAADFGVAGWLSWLWPLLIDLSLVVFTLSYYLSNLTGKGSRLAVALIGVYTALTISFNLIHSDPTILPERLTRLIVAVIAPVSLFFTTEALAQMFKSHFAVKPVADEPVADEPVVVMTGNEPATGDAGGGDHLTANDLAKLFELLDQTSLDDPDSEYEPPAVITFEIGELIENLEFDRRMTESHEATSEIIKALARMLMTDNEPVADDAGGGDHLTANDPQNTANEPVKKRPVDQTDKERAANLGAANKVKQQATTETTEAVHKLTASGMSRQQIADELDCSLATVTRHRRLAKEQGLNGVGVSS